MLLLAISNLSDLLMSFIPKSIKLATVVGMGLLLTFIGNVHTFELYVLKDHRSTF